MKRTRTARGGGGGRTAALALLLCVQAVAAAFFVGDVAADLSLSGLDAHVVLEAAVALALVVGVVFGALEMRRMLERAERSEHALSAARGAFADLMESHFARWRLTPAEADVALLALKGLEVAAIAEVRGAAQGTVRAQLARVYAKAGVSSRAELLSLFIDDLIDGPLGRGDQPDDGELPAKVHPATCS